MKKLGLRARAALAVGILVLALTVLVTFVVTRADAALASLEQARFAARTAQLADAVAYGVLAESEALVSEPLDSFARAPDVLRVEVRGAGRVIAERGATPRDARFGGIDVAATVSTRAGAPGDEAGELAAFGVERVEASEIGEVHAWFSFSAIDQVQARTRKEIVGAALALGLFGVLVSSLLMTSVVRRVRQVADAAARVRAGQVATTVEVSGDDELGRLAADFNAMTGALVEQQRKLDEAARTLADRESLAAIGRATAVIAHELKNPLGILLGASQIVANEKKPLAARAQAAAIVEEEVRRLARTLDDLLSYAKPRAPLRTTLDAHAVCAGAAVRATSAGGPFAGREGAVMMAAGAEHAQARVCADEGHVQQILLNLVQNAAQAGATRVSLAVAQADEGGVGRVHIVVDDDGPGVASEMCATLFLPFATDKQRGTGLGLAGSRQLARDNGGDLVHEPTATGARFVLTLERP